VRKDGPARFAFDNVPDNPTICTRNSQHELKAALQPWRHDEAQCGGGSLLLLSPAHSRTNAHGEVTDCNAALTPSGTPDATSRTAKRPTSGLLESDIKARRAHDAGANVRQPPTRRPAQHRGRRGVHMHM
jgi:hypothetical protein